MSFVITVAFGLEKRNKISSSVPGPKHEIMVGPRDRLAGVGDLGASISKPLLPGRGGEFLSLFDANQ